MPQSGTKEGRAQWSDSQAWALPIGRDGLRCCVDGVNTRKGTHRRSLHYAKSMSNEVRAEDGDERERTRKQKGDVGLAVSSDKTQEKKRRGGQISISDQCEQKTGAIDMSKTDRGKLNDRFWRL